MTVVQKNNPKGERNFALDLLRILAMFMIVLLHSGSHGKTLLISEGVNYYSITFHFIEALTICSVDVFVLISGYFLCVQKFRLSRIFKLCVTVLFYSIVWYLISVLVFKEPVVIKEIIKTIFPVSYSQYWFISAYIGMCLLSPIINFYISRISRTQFLCSIILLLCLFSVWPDFMILSNPMGVTERGCSVVWFLVLYMIAAYIRFYPINIKTRKAFSLYVFSALVLLFIWLVFAFLTSAQSFENEIKGDMITFYYYRYNSIIVLTMSVFLWLTFMNMSINNKVIQRIIILLAPLTMGVYLIHDNVHAREFIWKGLFNIEPTPIIPLFVIGYVFLVFISSLLIDKIRMSIFSIINKRKWYKSFMGKIDSFPTKISLYINNVVNK